MTTFLRAALLAASRNGSLRALATRQGVRFGAARFVAGEHLDDFVAVARKLNAGGSRVAAAYLGEGVSERAHARRIAGEFVAILRRIADERLDANVAVKLSHLGLDVSEAEAERNLCVVVAAAAGLQSFVRVDMEESSRVEATLRIFRSLRREGHDNVGVVLQASLHRSAGDLHELAPILTNVRLVKGAYLEAASVAYRAQRDIDRNYVRLIHSALRTTSFTAIATHDERIIEETLLFARQSGLAPGKHFEFQMLLGVRPALQKRLVVEGYPLRVSVPFGADWYPYLMRRMAENPRNLALILRNWATPRA